MLRDAIKNKTNRLSYVGATGSYIIFPAKVRCLSGLPSRDWKSRRFPYPGFQITMGGSVMDSPTDMGAYLCLQSFKLPQFLSCDIEAWQCFITHCITYLFAF